MYQVFATAFAGRLNDSLTLIFLVQSCKVPLLSLLMTSSRPVRLSISVAGNYLKSLTVEEGATETFYFQSKALPVLHSSNVGLIYDEHIEFRVRGSIRSLQMLMYMDVHVSQYRLFTVGAAQTKLPKIIVGRKTCIDVDSRCGLCFHYADIAAFFPATQNVCRIAPYPNPYDVLNIEGLSTPVVIQDIRKFEENNSITIDVYCVVDKDSNIIDETCKRVGL
ncbi:hypothetical protein PR048_005666 [Dryococelus australis]|uniref:Uncharacterized protein n=1 Tax=Dryococelus australis TaxID=614101 RepID=A0ABQ9I8V8_9NEOP|nr:hypothetical protein PR048_005666 [Dryococelus australis]